MRIALHRGLYRDAAGTPAGGGTGVAEAPAAGQAGTPPAGAGNGTPPNPQIGGGPAPGKFDWKGLGLEPDVQAVVDTHQWENPNAAIRSYSNLHKLTSLPPERLLKLPNEKSTPEEIKEFRTKLGVPEKATDYKLPVPEGDKGEFAREAETWMHEAGVPQSAAVKLAAKWNEKIAATQKAQATQLQARNEAEVAALKTEWGVDYAKNEQLIDRAAAEFGMTKEHLDGLRQVMGPKAAMKFLQTIGSKLGTEGEFVDTERGGGGFRENMTAEQAKAELNRLTHDKTFQELFISKDPIARRDARALKDRLERAASPGVITYPSAAR